MTSLLDNVERVARNSRSIQSSASQIVERPRAGPFTRAVLYSQLYNLIREADASELGLFEISRPEPSREALPSASPNLLRATFPVATPLRKTSVRRDREDQRPKNHEPEVYAQAALKYIESYERVRLIPRAHSQAKAILEQAESARSNMHRLHEILEAQPTELSVPSKQDIQRMEARVKNLETKLAKLRKRTPKKEAVSKQVPKANKISPPAFASPQNEPDDVEAEFWTTPVSGARTLHFKDTVDQSLLSEQPNLADISLSFAASPLAYLAHQPEDNDPSPTMFRFRAYDESSASPQSESPSNAASAAPEPGNNSTESAGQRTITLDTPSMVEPAPGPPAPPPEAPETPSGKKQKIRITADVERIVTKIWQTVGTVIMPNHPFDVSGQGNANMRPPVAKVTISHLRSVADTVPTVGASPSSASSSTITSAHDTSQCTPQQVLTARLLLELLSSQPSFSLPLNRAKDLLAEKASCIGGAELKQNVTRIIYVCVGKRLLKVDRSGGEQILTFDV
ncbi:hypothetical protein FISHEDRAFT_57518 [Fistulina hepatica ATCC 64428]|uniref:Uncharacterized protein n=1 Tax=Fistulina hepatica ATCC 64428 TaxID=1128425 RepID=A0A0D7AIL0_9AGAR|nr:hypothetical protein FISHEDRAFT_57518 [Fistulina hepatica ATCC 64428]